MRMERGVKMSTPRAKTPLLVGGGVSLGHRAPMPLRALLLAALLAVALGVAIYEGIAGGGSSAQSGVRLRATSRLHAGATAHKEGLSATAYPTGVAAVPVEVVESTAPLLFRRKELRPGSGGTGATGGGLGQVIEFTVDHGRPWTLNAVASRLAHAPAGLFGGGPGAAGAFTVNGEPVRTQKRIDLRPGDVVRMELPGGGGYGPAGEVAAS